MNTLNDYLTEQQSRFIDELLDFLRIPSVSTDQKHDADVRRAAEFVAAKLAEAGLEPTLLETAGH
ncbi:MAG: peptidase M20, partial [Trueperaceae bacterium]|nr:peptidase M20 [Trueperaceae bacterium]